MAAGSRNEPELSPHWVWSHTKERRAASISSMILLDIAISTQKCGGALGHIKRHLPGGHSRQPFMGLHFRILAVKPTRTYTKAEIY